MNSMNLTIKLIKCKHFTKLSLPLNYINMNYDNIDKKSSPMKS